MSAGLKPYNVMKPIEGSGISRLLKRARRRWRRRGIERGGSPAGLDYAFVPRRTPAQAAACFAGDGGKRVVIHEATTASHPLPINVTDRKALPSDAGWWGYSFRDVPARPSGETAITTLPRCRIVQYRDPQQGGDYYPAVLTADDWALDLRELRFRDGHAKVLRGAWDGGMQGKDVEEHEKITWVVERVYDNHSHWLTAHLPKLLLLQQRGELDAVVLPRKITPAMQQTLRLVGIDPDRFRTFGDAAVLNVQRLTLLETDRFRPELLRLIPEALGINDQPSATRRVYISRSRAGRRKLANEDELWPMFAERGFERVWMEELPLDEQVALMKQTAILAGPHGAGLTNMLFCPAGCRVLEIADLSFPNPNFYAIASAMKHRYWVLNSESVGDGHPLEKDLRADPAAADQVLREMLADVENSQRGGGRA